MRDWKGVWMATKSRVCTNWFDWVTVHSLRPRQARTCKHNGRRLQCALWAFRRSRLRQCINKLQWKKTYYDAKQMTSFTWLVFVAAGKKNCDRQVYLLTVQKTRWQDFDVALVHRHPWSLIAKRTIVTRNLRAVRSVWVLRTNRKPGGKK